MKNYHETIMQKFRALSMALFWMDVNCSMVGKACDKDGCRKALDTTEKIINEFLKMPKWKKKILNWLLS